MNDKYEPCSICEEYIEGVICDKDKCPVAKMKAENIALNRRAIPSSGHILKVGNALLFAENEEDYDITINTIKTEAYKECVEKAKREIDRQPHSKSLEASGERFRIIKILDNLKKEMIGE